MCEHAPACPAASAPDREAARVIARHPGQGWGLLRDSVVVFEDTAALLPDGTAIEPHRAAPRSSTDGLLPGAALPRGGPRAVLARS